MSKAVLISIQPKWCEKIARGEKTIEVRKNRPAVYKPFKCYIYCTASGITAAERNRNIFTDLRCKVIGEFECRYIEEYHPDDMAFGEYIVDDDTMPKTCLSAEELWSYGQGATLYGWYISNLMIYDKPKELSEFRLYYCSVVQENGFPMPTHEIRRPPQSWCYVEEVQV